MATRLALVATLMLAACASAPAAQFDAPTEVPAPSFGSSDVRLAQAVESSVARWNAAACLNLSVSDAPEHAVQFGETRAERQGETTGAWPTATIRVLDDAPRPWWHYTSTFLE